MKILSIHRSKGLEFPVVFVSGLGRSFNRQDTRETVLIHPELGLGPKRTDPERKVEYPTVARRAIERRMTRELLSEEMRLLYVAMTRAKDRLFLTACLRKTDEQLERAALLQKEKKIPAQLLDSASNAVPWLLPTALENRTLRWRICTGSEKQAEQKTEETEKQLLPDQELFARIKRSLSATYPYPAAEHLPSKLTATELKMPDPDAASLRREYRLFQALDLDDECPSATEVGTATHLVLQQIDLKKTGSEDEIRQEVERLQNQCFLTRVEAEAVEKDRILRFFSSGIGRRIRKAEKVWREFRFSLMTDVSDLLPEEQTSTEERILLQGVVDCFFLENNEIVIVDYKTDRVRDDAQLGQRAEHYRVQLETYAMALGRIFQLPVKEKVLYFLRSDRAVILK